MSSRSHLNRVEARRRNQTVFDAIERAQHAPARTMDDVVFEAFDMGTGQTLRALRRLEADGLIDIQTHPSDSRRRLIKHAARDPTTPEADP
jgi:hypothetical protein